MLEGIATQFVALAGHIAWPLTIVVIVCACRRQLQRIIEAVAKRIGDTNSSLSIKKGDLELRLEAAQRRIETMGAVQDLTRGFVLEEMSIRPNNRMGGLGSADGEIDDDLIGLANEYLAVDSDDWSERVRRKNEITTRLAYIVLATKVPKERLAQSGNEGLIVALAGSILVLPEPGDVDLLIEAAPAVRSKHLKYRIAISIARLFEQSLVPENLKADVAALLSQFETGADEALRSRIRRTRALIDTLSQEGSVDLCCD